MADSFSFEEAIDGSFSFEDAQIKAPQHPAKDYLYGAASLPGEVMGAAEWIGKKALGREHGFGDIGEGVTESLTGAVGAEKPSTMEGEARAQAGQGLAMIAPTLPFVGPGVGALEAGAAVTGPFINKWMQDKFRDNENRAGREDGLGRTIAREGAGFGAEMGLAVAAPGTAAKTVSKIPSRAKRIKQAFEASPEIRALAKRLDVNVRDLFKESEEIKRLFPKAPDGTESIINDAIERSHAVVDDFPDPMRRPRTLQAIENDIARGNLSNAEEALGKLPGSTKEWVPEIEGKQSFLEDELQRRFDEIQFEGSAPGLNESHKAGSANVRQQTREKWSEAEPFLDQYEFSAEDTRQVAQELIDKATDYGDVPELIHRLAGETDKTTYTLREIQAMQSDLKSIVRDAAQNPAKEPAANWASQMLAQLKKQEGSIPDAEVVPALREARAATARKKDLLAKTPANRALRDKDQVREVGLKVVNSKDDARRAVEVLSDVDGGMDNLRNVVTESVWGDELFDKETRISPKRVKAQIKKYRDGLLEVFGREHLDRMENLSEYFSMTDRGRLGTVGASRGAGSNQPGPAAVLASAADTMNPAMISPRSILKMVASVESNPKRIRIFQEFFKDPETAAMLLELPTDRGKAAWVLGWKKLLARTSARSVATHDAPVGNDLLGGKPPQGVNK